MWFVFPQVAGLGSSPTARLYGLRDAVEARAYLTHPVLGARLHECTGAMVDWAGRKSAEAILGSIDAMKFVSSMTLFDAVSHTPDNPFARALAAFFRLLPAKLGTRKLRHALEPRHPSFDCPEYLALARKFKVATVLTDSPKYPNFTELTAPFVYARLMNAKASCATGYTRPALKQWAAQATAWRDAGAAQGRDVFVYFINGAKERAPAAALQLIKTLE
jgi:uncharacterized protein (DUF1810 family)